MKKTILTFVCGILLHFSYAQDQPQIPACVMINGAYNMSSLYHHDYFFASNLKPGFTVGVLFRSNDDLYLLTGLQYVIANSSMKLYSTNVTDDVAFQFLQIPIQIGLHIIKSEDSKHTLHAQVGGSLSALLGVGANEVGIVSDSLNKIGFCFKIGVGTDQGRFSFDFNHNFLFSHLYDMAGYDNRAKLMCWELSIAYKINLKEKEGAHRDE